MSRVAKPDNLKILHDSEVMKFETDWTKWAVEKINDAKNKFKAYNLSAISVGISAGIPSGVTASVTITLTPKQP